MLATWNIFSPFCCQVACESDEDLFVDVWMGVGWTQDVLINDMKEEHSRLELGMMYFDPFECDSLYFGQF